MTRTERIALLHKLLRAHRYGLSLQRLMQESGGSRSTVLRDLGFLRDTLGAPLELEGDPARVYRYVGKDADAFQLPGLWLSPDELYELLLAQQMLQRSGGTGLLSQALRPLEARIVKLLGPKVKRLERLKVLRTQARRSQPAQLRVAAEAVLETRQLRFCYGARSTGLDSDRRVSPQRLLHYRDNWYLDAWDHGANAVRRFALDRLRQPQLLNEPAHDLALEELGGYGIFSGPPIGHAILHFTAHGARWVADEEWHPKQRQRALPDGGLELIVPYANPRELLMDVMRYGPDVVVVGPPELRAEITRLLLAAVGRNQ